ncbi:MAG: sigma-70 family RNA polymerase sigma factor [Acidobacteria bacterium]|nr:sigma-70 family RNA polymerase sigma factor [Acidobacteriota bacterium]MBI3655298.1 sigma-70 family RNA polymerase sigma factor [Acidobacteriota bacterium]
MKVSPKDVTQMLADSCRGHPEALANLLPLVYNELRRLARRYLRDERSGHTLQATALVHEVYLRLIGQTDLHWQNRAHFFGLAAQAMRRILIEHARHQRAAKRGGPHRSLFLNDAVDGSGKREVDLLVLDEALNRLATFDSQKGRIVELRFFGGLTIQETAHVLGVSTPTVERGWQMAKLWLHRELQKGALHDD